MRPGTTCSLSTGLSTHHLQLCFPPERLRTPSTYHRTAGASRNESRGGRSRLHCETTTRRSLRQHYSGVEEGFTAAAKVLVEQSKLDDGTELARDRCCTNGGIIFDWVNQLRTTYGWESTLTSCDGCQTCGHFLSDYLVLHSTSYQQAHLGSESS